MMPQKLTHQSDTMLPDGSIRGFVVFKRTDHAQLATWDTFEVVPYTKRSLTARRYYYRDNGQQFRTRHLALAWGRGFRDNGWSE